MVDQEDDVARHFTINDLRDLFKLEENTVSDTHAKYEIAETIINILDYISETKDNIIIFI